MQFSTLPALALMALAHFAREVAANSGWYQTCNSGIIGIPGGNDPHETLVANCKIGGGEYNVGTEINLDSCFGNSGGTIVGQLK